MAGTRATGPELRRDEPPAAALAADGARQVAQLLHQTVALGRLEVEQRAAHARRAATAIPARAAVAFAAAGVLTGAAVLGLAQVVYLWLAFFIVGAVLLTAAGILALTGGVLVWRAVPPVPERTLDEVRADLDAVEEAVRG